jgi:hypothetical protein
LRKRERERERLCKSSILHVVKTSTRIFGINQSSHTKTT